MKRPSRNSTHDRWLVGVSLVLALLLSLLIAGCTPDEKDTEATAISLALAEIVDSVSSDHGTVVEVHEGDGTPIVVFQEMHDSALQQAQIAAMLNLFYTRFGLRTIGLEGACAERPSEYAIVGGTYEPSRPLNERELVDVQLLANGEISAAELMAAIYGDVLIEPVETTRLYDRTDGIEDAGIPIYYLSLTALTYLDEDEVARILDLGTDDMVVAALMDAIERVPETRELMGAFEGRCTCDQAHLESVIDLAVERGVADHDELELEFAALRRFSATACERGAYMAGRMRDIAQQAVSRGERVVAIVSGAAHCEIPEKLAQASHAYVVIQPAAYGMDDDPTSLESNQWDRAMEGLAITKSETLREALDRGFIKPRPVTGKPWLRAEKDICYIVSSITQAAAEGHIPPFTKQALDDAGVPDSEYVNVVSGSLSIDDGEVVFALTFPDENLEPVTMWIRSVVDRTAVEQTLAERLDELIHDLSDGSERGRTTEVAPGTTAIPVSPTVKAAFCGNEEVAKSFRFQD